MSIFRPNHGMVVPRILFLAPLAVGGFGCSAGRSSTPLSERSSLHDSATLAAATLSPHAREDATSTVPASPLLATSISDAGHLRLTSHVEPNAGDQIAREQIAGEPNAGSGPLPSPVLRMPDAHRAEPGMYVETLSDLEGSALANNPSLRRLRQEAAAARAKIGYLGRLPDPTVGATFFLPPMNFDPDRQVAESQVMQMVPWLGRLRAEESQACFEALAAENMAQAEQLRILGELRSTWSKIYVLTKQIETTDREKGQLESLVQTAAARVAAASASQGDVLLAALELSALDEQLISYRQQLAGATAELNRLAGRDAALPVAPPTSIDAELPDWDYEMLRQVARQSQPELQAARLRTAAARWGVEVARLRRRPDVTFGAGWLAMDAPGAAAPGAGRDSFTMGVATTVPIGCAKYDAMAAEASREHAAAHASEDEVAQRLDALLRELWESALASRRTMELYEASILPQARQAFEADQQGLANNSATFERVIRGYRTLLNLELGYQRARGELAGALARIRQTVGVDLEGAKGSAPL